MKSKILIEEIILQGVFTQFQVVNTPEFPNFPDTSFEISVDMALNENRKQGC